MSVFARVFVAIVVAGSVGLAAETLAQMQPPAGQRPPPSGVERPATGEREVEGQVRSIDSATREVTLTDGTKLMIPAGAQLPPDVKEGVIIIARYKEEAGEKVLTGIGVQPSASPGTAPPAGSPRR
ncbi:MAG: hypothetical protein ACREM3_25910 [Candidatus Rokuibacteriota bacterium]